MNLEKDWRLVSIRISCEKKIIKNLNGLGISFYFPVIDLSTTKINENYSAAYLPLFPTLLLIHISEDQIKKIEQINGILNFMYWHQSPAVIDEKDLHRLKHFLHAYEGVFLKKQSIAGAIETNASIMNEIRTKALNILMSSFKHKSSAAIILEFNSVPKAKIHLAEKTVL